MTEEQNFLKVCLVDNLDISTKKGQAQLREIAKSQNVMESELIALFNNFKSEIKRIKSLHQAKKDKMCADWLRVPANFYQWYLEQPRKCSYCGVSEEQVREYFKKNPSRGGRRGQNLEIERIVPKDPYSPENCIMACYVCNNAKSDFMSNEDFKPIADGIKKFWKK